MGHVVAIVNQKGGVGKTTTAVNLAAYLGATGRVLLVDLDPQANATSSLGTNNANLQHSMYDVLLGQVGLHDIVVPTREHGLFLAPAAAELAGAQVELLSMDDRDLCLRHALEPARSSFDLILVDCPPSLGILTVNALAAADALLAPVQCEYLALEGLTQLLRIVRSVRAGINPSIKILGIVLTMFDSRTNLSVQVVEEIRRHFPVQAFDSIVPRSVRLSEAPSYGQSIRAYDPSSRGALAYAQLAREVIERGYGPETLQ